VVTTFIGRVASGLPYTPLVSSDINGDGRANDRAFAFDPERIRSEAPALAGQIEALLGRHEGACLRGQLAEVVAPQSCTGPWFTTSNLRVRYLGGVTMFGRRVYGELNVSNPVAGLDRLLHGSGEARWWGSSLSVDPTLYQVRGFDATRRAFKYEVNSGFGRPFAGEIMNPTQLTLDVGIALGTPVAEQMLSRVLAQGRGGDTRPKQTVESIRARYARTVVNVFAVVLQESDSLLLTASQVDSLLAAQARYRARVNVVWMSLAQGLHNLPDDFKSSAALDRVNRATEDAWAIVKEEAAIIPRVLSPLQLTMLPAVVRLVLDSPGKITLRIY
jgi:hypothetical protein